MRDGMLVFTNYTNKWKGNEAEAKMHTQKCKGYSLDEIKKEDRKFWTLRRLKPCLKVNNTDCSSQTIHIQVKQKPDRI